MVRSISSLSVGLSWTPILTPFPSHINSTFPFLAPSTGFQDPTSCGQSNWTFSYSFPMPCWRLTLTKLRLQILLLDSSSSSLYMSKSEPTLYIWLKCLPPPRSLPGCLLSFTTYWFPTLSANVPLRVVAIEIKGLVLAFGSSEFRGRSGRAGRYHQVVEGTEVRRHLSLPTDGEVTLPLGAVSERFVRTHRS